jgi:hypothetical protein
MTDHRVRFTVRAGKKTLRFSGHIEGDTLTGTLTTIEGGVRQESQFKARRVYGD